MFGYGTPIGSHFAPHHPAYEDLTGFARLRPGEGEGAARRGRRRPAYQPTLMLPPPSYARRGGEIVAAQLRAVGIEPQIVNVEWAQWLEQVFKNKDYDLTIVSHTEPMDIGIYARPDYYFDYDRPGDARALGRRRRHRRPGRAGRDSSRRRRSGSAANAVNVFLFQLAKTGVADARCGACG